MAKDKKSFILYCDQKGLWDKLSDDQAGKLIKHIIAYVNDENPTAPDFITELAFEPIKQQLKRDLQQWSETRESRSMAGKAGAEARWQKIANDGKRISDIAKMAVNENVNVNDNVNVTVSENKRTQFILGTPNDTKYFLIVPKSPVSPIYRINGEDGMMELFELNQSVIKNKSAINTFLLNNSGAHFNEFSHVYNKFNLHIENNTQAYGR